MKTSWQWIARTVCVLACVGAASCGSTKTTFLEDGTHGYTIRCKGYLNSWESCLIKAGKLCESRGYRTIRSEEYDRTMIVACKVPGAASMAGSTAAQ
jgi:hypothetical protein